MVNLIAITFGIINIISIIRNTYYFNFTEEPMCQSEILKGILTCCPIINTLFSLYLFIHGLKDEFGRIKNDLNKLKNMFK